MPRNIVEKVLHGHLAEGVYDPGKEIAIGIDQTLAHDATGTMAFLQFEALGVSEIRTDLSVTYIDHNTQQIGFENCDDHLYLQSVSAKFGAVYSRAGNRICHQVHLERSGKTIECTCTLSEKQTAVILAGGLLNHITSA
jgi:aconitate hydratase